MKNKILTLGTILISTVSMTTSMSCSDEYQETSESELIFKRSFEAYVEIDMLRSEFKTIEFEGTFDEVFDKIRFGSYENLVSKEKFKQFITTEKINFNDITVKKPANKTHIIYSVPALGDYVMEYNDFNDEGVLKPSEKVEKIENVIKAFTFGSKLDKDEFMQGSMIGSEIQNNKWWFDSLGLIIPEIVGDGAVITLSKLPETTTLIFTIEFYISEDLTINSVVEYPITEFNTLPEMWDRVSFIKNEIKKLTFQSRLEESVLESITLDKQEWDGTTAIIPGIEAISSAAILDRLGTTITITKEDSSLEVLFLIWEMDDRGFKTTASLWMDLLARQ